MYSFARDYLLALFHYWWVMVFVLVGAVNTVWKWLHPNRTDFPVPHWLRLTIAVGAVLIAQGLAYRDSIKNLNVAIQEKQLLSSENWHLQNAPKPVCPTCPICPPSKPCPQSGAQSTGAGNVEVKREIQSRLSQFMKDGNDLRDAWRKVMGNSEDIQRTASEQVRQWHARLEKYLRTIPRGDVYLNRLNSAQKNGAGGYPLGLNSNVGDEYDLLISDLTRLNEFVGDPELGEL